VLPLASVSIAARNCAFTASRPDRAATKYASMSAVEVIFSSASLIKPLARSPAG
jgi:hypothetical protein